LSTKGPEVSLTYLADMADRINKIFAYTEGLNLEQFCKDRRTVDSVCFNLAVLGEAANKVPSQVQQQLSDVPWRKIISTRNKLIHGYSTIDDELIWDIVKTDLPNLLRTLERVVGPKA
jgi:uncharacterized protein with HEPN domain